MKKDGYCGTLCPQGRADGAEILGQRVHTDGDVQLVAERLPLSLIHI